MHNELFGELQFEYGWNGTTSLDWFGRNIDVDLVVDGEEDESIDSLQCESYKAFKESWNTVKEQILDAVLSYYNDLRDELGYSDGSNDDYPEITTRTEIKEMIGLDSVIVPISGIYDGRSISLAFHCEWDKENGLGIILIDESISEIGYQDIAF
ncbi:MAG: DUF2004 domain-containing protein [Lachnospiraceae bacterium]|nr:DUF2004 domain-containing protein [Lachnospiraceae bacterium]